jgi:hypothetical protein
MTADGNGSRTLRVPSHIDYSAEGARLGAGLMPRAAQFPQQFARQLLKAPLDQCAAMDNPPCL